MKGIITICSFLLIGIATAIYIGFGFQAKPVPKAIDHELEGLNEKYILRFSHVVAENTPKGIAANMLATLIREKTNGWVEVQVYPNGILYEAQEEFGALLRNEVHIIAPALSEVTVHDPKWIVMDIPHIFDNEEMVQQAFDGRIGELLFESIERYGYIGVAFWDNSFKQFTNNIRPVQVPEDIRGLSVRVMPSEALMSTYRMLGAFPRSYPFNEVYDLLRYEKIDGTENTLSNIYSKGFYQHQKYMTISNHNYLGYAVLMNSEFLATLPVDYQKNILEAIEEVTEWLRGYAKEHNEEMLERIEMSSMIDIHYLTEEELLLWKKALKPIYEKYEPIIGPELMGEVYKLQE